MEIEICFELEEKEIKIHGRTNFYFDNFNTNVFEECINKTYEKINSNIKITSVHAWPSYDNENEKCVADTIPVHGA